MDIVSLDFESFEKSIKDALNAIAAHKQIAEQSAILIKPNLTNSSTHPITTSPECCKAIIDYIRLHSNAEIVIAEGCGDAHLDTDEIFNILGYTAMARDLDVSLLDLNYGPVKKPLLKPSEQDWAFH